MGVKVGYEEQVKLTYRIYIDGEIDSGDYFTEVIDLLAQAEEDDTFIFMINSGGGRLDATTSLINSIVSTKAHTVAVITDDASSAAALIFIACAEHLIYNTSSLMLHECSYGLADQSSKIKAASTHISKKFELLFDLVAEGFLTETEKSDMYKGVELYFIGEEIAERMQKVYELRVGDEDSLGEVEQSKTLLS